MARLSSPLENLREHYDVVVVGSGYGGGIAASRLARAGRSVCLLERGREYLPGEFPDTFAEAVAATQIDRQGSRLGASTGLFDFRVNDDINVLVGCGLGGTSLINANVVVEADPQVFDDPAWPAGFRDDLDTRVAEGYRRAREMLRPTPYPDHFPPLRKFEALQRSAAHLGETAHKLPIAVTFESPEGGVNHVGVEQQPCALCGDCVSGCNHQAKNTVQLTYLPDAWNHGAEIFTEVGVRYLERQAGRWLVHFEPRGVGREAFGAPELFVAADLVVLAGGTLGSTEILLRSRERGLPLSDRLGQRFSGNGDVVAFAYNNDLPINGIGWGSRPADNDNPVGPCITGIIDTRDSASDFREGMSIEEGTMPGALSRILPGALSSLTKVIGEDTDRGLYDFMGERGREFESLIRGAYHGAVNHTQTFLVMTHDSRRGVMVLEDDRLRIDWPGAGREDIIGKVEDRVYRATEALGGTYLGNPICTRMFGHELITVHPLGGCAMGEDAAAGVVDHSGQVFAASTGDACHEGLYVADGSVIPTSLGTNPLLTICATAERTVALIAEQRGWHIDYRLPSRSDREAEPVATGLRFTETMTGHVSVDETEDRLESARPGQHRDSPFTFTVTVVCEDVEAVLADPSRQARMFGTVEAPALSPESMTIHDGLFTLFEPDPDEVGTRRMRYRMKLASQDGDRFYVEGFKRVHNDPRFDLWGDTSTLYITIYRGEDDRGEIVGRGTLRIRPADFARQMTTMQVTNAATRVERLATLGSFGRTFGGTLFDIYGGVFAGRSRFDPEAPPRKRRPLEVAAPEVHGFNTEDGVGLRLTRYRGGGKGPVLLLHGLGVSSRIFTVDTIEPNLLEYLFAHGYDVWLLDFRASIDLPGSEEQFSGDDVARYDYPAAVAVVRDLTGADSVQVVAHCFGSTVFTLSLLGGWLEGVRAAVCSQVAAHVNAPLSTRAKAGLHVPNVLKAVGAESLTAYTGKDSNWSDRFFDDMLRLFPVKSGEGCGDPICRRVTFLYGQLYQHDQLNAATHHTLHELFGVANLSAFEHLTRMVRQGRVVTATGEDAYLPHLERMAFPITFISGANNGCYLPESTERTYRLLQEANGEQLYRRHVIAGYGHIDCIFGKNAARDVYPYILDQLEETA